METSRAHIPGVVRYYNQTWFDYRTLWMTRRNVSMHLGFWDDTTRGHVEACLAMNQAVADAAGVAAGARVLDAGCGVGGTAMWLAEERGARVHGVTVPTKQVRRARRFARLRGLSDRCTFSQQDYQRLTFPEHTFDVVWGLESICHAPAKAPFLAEAHRVLKPGGRLVVADFFRTSRPYEADDERRLADFLDGWAMADLATPAEFGAWAEQAGFTDVTVQDISQAVVPSLRRLYRMGTMFFVPASTLYLLGLRSKVQQGNLRSSRTVWQTFQRDLWRYAILVARKPA
jgi:tocopherol O-methyltransferase